MSETFFMLCWVSQSFFAWVLRLFSARSVLTGKKLVIALAQIEGGGEGMLVSLSRGVSP